MTRQNFEQILFDDKMPVKAMVQRQGHFKLHWHQHPELLYVVKGTIRIHYNTQSIVLHQGQMMYIASSVIHGVDRMEDENLLIAIQFDTDFFLPLPNLKDMQFQIDLFLKAQNAQPDEFKELRSWIVDIVWAYNKRPKGYRYHIAAISYSILAELISRDYYVPKPPMTQDQEYMCQRVQNVLNYIQEHYSEPISLKDIADAEHISYYYLSHIFREVTGITFREHLCNVRLHKSLEMLRQSKASILNVAIQYGFSSSKSYSTAFREHYGVTPGEFRRAYQQTDGPAPAEYTLGNENHLMYASNNAYVDLSEIYALHNDRAANSDSRNESPEEQHPVEVDVSQRGETLNHCWSKIGTCGTAVDLQRSEVRRHVLMAKEKLGIEYLRFHGIFCDQMMIFNRRTDGSVVYNWIYVDQIFDFLLRSGIRPFLEMSFTPSDIATGGSELFWYRANVSQPQLPLWADMVRALICHCLTRYGMEEVSRWYVEVWNEPDYQGVFFDGSMEDYFRLYECTVKSVKQACPGIRVGGPAITSVAYHLTPWILGLVRHCHTNGIPLDFLSFHLYNDRPNGYQGRSDSFFIKMDGNADLNFNLETDMAIHYRQQLESEGLPVPDLMVTEWNLSAKQRFTIRDTAFMAPYVVQSALKASKQLKGFAFWVITDLIEEVKAPVEPFHGGLGMVNIHGIPKCSFHGLALLNRLGDTLLGEGEGWIVTRRGEVIQILTWNMVKPDRLAQHNANFSQGFFNRIYDFFEEKPTWRFCITLHGMKGKYLVRSEEINRQKGCAYDTWLQIGMPTNPDDGMVEYMKAASVPAISFFTMEASKGALKMYCNVPIHGVRLMEISPVYE